MRWRPQTRTEANFRGLPSLKITPSNSPILRPGSRSLSRSSHQSSLSLQTVLGTTTTTPNGFSSHDQSKSFALCAGSAAVLAELDDDANVTQRFFRARPSATSMNPTTSFYNQSTPPTTPDTRSRSIQQIRSNPHLNLPNVATPSSDLPENGSPRTLSSRERIKAVTSVSISPNGRFLAVGETGYNPRVMIFSTAKDASPDVPLSILSEHTFGVRCLAFSPDSQYLATLGSMNDGFLFIWTINLKNGSAKLHSTNRCTSFVRDICWIGQSLVTVGVRHVKVWRLPTPRPISPTKTRLASDSAGPSPSPAPKALSGRNCLLGALGDTTFSCVSSISDQEAVVGTESGAVCLIDDRESSQKLTVITQVGFCIASLAVDFDRETIWVGGRGRKMQRLSFDAVRSPPNPAPMSPARSEKGVLEKRSKIPAITCMGSLFSHMVTVESTREIHIYPIDALREEGEQELGETSMPAHRDPVYGVRSLGKPNELKADFFSWSRNGSQNYATEDEMSNELKVVRAGEQGKWFVSGDKLGILKLLAGSSPWVCTAEVRAHGGEITDIALHSSAESTLVATSGRDRMVQLFEKKDDSLELVQTMDEHVGSVGQIMFMNDGEKLLSSSADRTILIRERATREEEGSTLVAYLISKVVTLKASPVSMTLCPDDSNALYLSTMDRNISKFDVPSARQLHSFRAADSDGNDAVIMCSLTVKSEVPGQSPKLLIGLSSTDKSIRVYDLEKDTLIAGEFGHTEGVSDVLLLDGNDDPDKPQTQRSLISAGIDGILMIWGLCVQPQASLEASLNGREEEGPAKETTAARPPLRKVLSRSEMAGFRPENTNPYPIGTPTPVRDLSPTLRRKLSKLSLTPSNLKNQSVAETPSPPNRLSPTNPSERSRRSPSPVSPRSKPPSSRKPTSAKNHNRRTSLDFRNRKVSGRGEFGSLEMSTEQLCRTLKTYRRKLNGSSQKIQAHKELERELSLTLRAVNARAINSDESGETETDSGKEIDRRPSYSSVSSLSPRQPRRQSSKHRPQHVPHTPRHAPSTPVLRQKGLEKVSRSQSYDAATGK
ncbi:hypothetical protein N7470_005906 [Penicillium chermesinum]|nr:hypothetical protein N7470_005906 [Penicillium chermesinum]